ncbi:unnamed protein product [Ectocarpus sp. 13 AM-2016]
MAELVVSVLGALARAREAVESAQNFPSSFKDQLLNATSTLQQLQRDPRHVARIGIEDDLTKLDGLADGIKNLVQEFTAAPTDSCCQRVCKSIARCSRHKELEEQLQKIDKDIDGVLRTIAAKGVTGVAGLFPPPLPEMAAVPAGALALPGSYVERGAVQEVADGVTNPKEPRTPFTVVGMGGGGKSVLASAVVRKSNVREHFRGGILWMRVGRDAKNSLLPLLQGLAREMGAAPTDTPRVLDSLEKVQQHLGTVASTGNSPRLVVLDDVWEREVVDAILPLGLKVLVTTRDRSVVGVPTECWELGDMTEEEALELLLKTSRTVGQPGDGVRTQMIKVVALCGRLPLVLAIAGGMAVVKGKGLTAGAWEVLIEDLTDVSEKMRGRGEQSTSLKVVLETSLDALTRKKQDFVFKLAVLAPGAGAPIDMLLNLWEIQEVDDTREEADGLVSKCLLQDVGRGGHRVHDLVLEFLKDNIKTALVEKATMLQARFLGRLDVLKGYKNPEHGAGNQGLFVLDALWRSVEKLCGDSDLEVASYSTSLGELESCEATKDVADSYASVGFLFNIQGKYDQADPLYVRVLQILAATVGEETPNTLQRSTTGRPVVEPRGKIWVVRA